MFIAATGDGQWRTLCRILGRDDLLADIRLGTNNQRVVAREWLLPTLRETLRRFEGKSLAVELEQKGIPFAPITRPEQLFDDPHLLASGGLSKLTLDDGTQTDMPLLPFSLDGERLLPRMPIARIGEHTREVMRELGYGDEQIDRLLKEERQGMQA
jgi:crotonobetainyl-CoA:carnitine CoA-transferase CaiB-like acyl-CoA transferase